MFKSIAATAALLLGATHLYAASYSQAADVERQATIDRTIDTWQLHASADVRRLTAVSVDPI